MIFLVILIRLQLNCVQAFAVLLYLGEEPVPHVLLGQSDLAGVFLISNEGFFINFFLLLNWLVRLGHGLLFHEICTDALPLVYVVTLEDVDILDHALDTVHDAMHQSQID